MLNKEKLRDREGGKEERKVREDKREKDRKERERKSNNGVNEPFLRRCLAKE